MAATDTQGVLMEAMKAHLAGDAAFSDLDQIRLQWPKRGHVLPDQTAIIEPNEPQEVRFISQGELEVMYPMTVTFMLRLTDDDDNNVGEILLLKSEELYRDFRAIVNPFSTAVLPSQSKYIFCLVPGFLRNPAPITDFPRYHGIQLTIEPHICEER